MLLAESITKNVFAALKVSCLPTEKRVFGYFA
jgi:hypothetical protein